MVSQPKNHVPVLLSETLEYLKIRSNSVIVDCTLGLGGHSMGILHSNDTVKVIGIDQDASNLKEAKERLKPYGDRVSLHHRNFEELYSVIEEEGLVGRIDGILLDLGICSTHIDNPERGFSFRQEGPLDMRFDRTKDFTAADIIREYSAEKLQETFSKYGEEQESKTVAEAIVEARKKTDIQTTTQLIEIIENAKRFRKPGKSAGTNVFQALRIEVNQEFRVLEKALEDAIKILAPGGRIVVIAYHSLEDRIVKLCFKKYEAKGKKDDEWKLVKFIVKTPLKPTEEEVQSNPRSRSAMMRVVERV
ncbi:MAG: 16S rRNA (cytosine(1402)-N(4))-methyltransferase RsmH [Candidatus Peregrinibacteria bacterium]|nr:16S rRNA (cytosine(1402)-N(4))-methyltransferase RsmH [Candidatus Peregrinibacteria bacterium]MDZ4244995.1 16S rRNA (cytosine(1402)-N(4))-methyltransferase RsmH [Candidatus Gracilibacteria bacterium]